MLRLLSIRNFVVVESLDLELDGGFSVLTGETGAGKSILLDALALLLGDRFELRQLRPGAERAELAAEFDIDGRANISSWLADQGPAAEGTSLAGAQSRLAHAAALLETAASGEDELTEGDGALARRLSSLLARLDAGAAHDPALKEVVALLEPARIQLVEAARELRAYRQKLDLDPAELARIEERQAAIHDAARKYRVR